jgi:hypothetical protein
MPRAIRGRLEIALKALRRHQTGPIRDQASTIRIDADEDTVPTVP